MNIKISKNIYKSKQNKLLNNFEKLVNRWMDGRTTGWTDG